MNVETQLVMPGGWHYLEGDVKLEATSYFDLLSTVQRFRLENSRPVGDVKGDVDRFICKNFPRQCHDLSGRTAIQPQRSPTQSDLITEHMTALRKKSPTLVFQPEAEIRANACVNCPHNQFRNFGCASCGDNITRLGAFIRKGKDVSVHRRLHFCDVFHQDNRTTVWVEGEFLDKSASVPDNCWRKP